MPLIGLVASVDWRLAFLALPLPAALSPGSPWPPGRTTAPYPARGGRSAGCSASGPARRWALGELFANIGLGRDARLQRCALQGDLRHVVGAEQESPSRSSRPPTSPETASAGGSGPGRTRPADDAPRQHRRRRRGGADLVAHAAASPLTMVFFSLAAVIAARERSRAPSSDSASPAGSGARWAPSAPSTTQLGYLIGSLVGGAAYALAGFTGLGVVFGGLFLASTLPYAALRVARTKIVLPEGARP